MRRFLFLLTLFLAFAIVFTSAASVKSSSTKTKTTTKKTSITSKNCNKTDISATYTKWKKIIKAVAKVTWDTRKSSTKSTSTKKSRDVADVELTGDHLYSKRTRTSTTSTNVTTTYGNTYTTIFDGTGNLTDAAVQMPAYITYHLVSNTTTYTLAKAACLMYCDTTSGCASVNMYYELNNPLYDWVFSEKSNLVCALYGDIPVASQKTNPGGLQLKPAGYPKTTIQQSSSYGNLNFFNNITTPSGYQLSYGPISAANNAPGYMNSSILTFYDPSACAALCTAQTPDPTGGACSYFNIWRSLLNGAPNTYTCSLYYLNTDASTANNTGDSTQGITVTQSRGYVHTYALVNPGFESGLTGWNISDTDNMAITTTAHSGSAALAMGTVDELGSLHYTANSTITLKPNTNYTLGFWLAVGNGDTNSVFNVVWNGVTVYTMGASAGTAYTQYNITVPGLASNDLLFSARNDPSWWFLDDIKIVG